MFKEELPDGVCLNVNFPQASVFKGVKVCRMNRGVWVNECEKMHHPRGYEYFWITGEFRSEEPEAEDTDRWALDNNYVAVTPTKVDVTDYATMNRLKQWEMELGLEMKV